ncbi:MAG: TRAP transporter substrate-binding protein [Alphaproteobacteria bacterium]|nr:TRAP transporter substrate-binding protein [Alphaproteobacteria bacterium]
MTRMLSLAALAAVLAVGAQAQTKWDMALAYPVGNYHTVNAQKFADAVKARSGGKLEIVLHPNGSLFKAPEIKRAVQTAQVPIGEVLMVNLHNEDPFYSADGVPFLATSFADAKKLMDAQKPGIARRMGSQGVVFLYAVPWPPQGIYADKELKSLGDMEGLKWRAYSPQTARIAEIVKAQPLTIQAAELAQALATGKVNSFVSSGVTGVDSKTYEHLKFFHDTQAWLPKNMVLVNHSLYSRLDEATRRVLVEEAQKAEAAGWEAAKKIQDESIATLAKNGMTIVKPSAQFVTELKTKVGAPMIAEWAKGAGGDGEMLAKALK